ncbi:protein kinase [Lentisphaera marina]|uniref:protein kinase domain-containing protein n=1 Tax=Lentisphaera marina TaxID=1111041 RepID=UPI002366FE6F|nr:protein kinase [Lentisphaera marina]MDD7986025.1 protein kinase [Lentisphaera marina]
MERDDTLKLTYKFNDIYAEVLEDQHELNDQSTRPLFYDLATIEKQYSSFYEIAQGGMKSVYKVFDRKLNRYVAYAKLRPDTPEEVHDPFIREARLTALLEHPNIISVYDIGVGEDDVPFFTMELKVGDNLSKFMKDRPNCHRPGTSEFENLLESFIKICDAISYAHSKNVIHLDLKPDNIQLGQFGEVIVCDWGLGKIIGDKDIEYDQLLFNPDLLNNVTLTGKVVGTPGYMAPEQITLDYEKNFQTDIYSLGAILYKIITSKEAFDGEMEDMLRMTVQGNVIRPRDLNLSWQPPISLAAVVMKAMSLNPIDRYSSVDDLKKEVQKYLSGRSTEAEHAGVSTEIRLFYKRNKNLCLISVSSVFLIITLTIWFILQQEKTNKNLATERDRAELNRRMMANERDSMIMEKDLATALLGKDRETIMKIFEFTDYHIFKSPVSAVRDSEKLLMTLEGNQRAAEWADMQKNHIHFLSQNFRDFENTYMKRSRDYGLVELISQLKYDQNIDLLKIDSLLTLLKYLIEKNNNLADAVKILKYDGAMRPSQKDHSFAVKTILEAINKDWKQGQFDYDEKSQVLKISGQGFKRFEVEPYELDQRGTLLSKAVCVIDSLIIKELHLANSSVYNLWSIGGTNIEYLDISNTKVKDLSPIKTMKKLDTLVLSKNVYSEQDFRLLPAEIKIIIK